MTRFARRFYRHFTFPLIASAFMASAGLAQEPALVESTADDRSDIRITVYNNRFAAISETRELTISPGFNRIEFADVSAKIEPETALLEGGEFRFIEQNFDYDLLTPGKLIEKAVGEKVLVQRTNPATGETSMEEATVLAASQGIVVQYEDGIEIFGQSGLPERFAFQSIPENLRSKPTLSTLVGAGNPFRGEVKLSYLSGGFTWKADYVGNLDEDEDEMDVQAWITLSNTSGTNFTDVKLQVVAGEVNRVSGAPEMPRDVQYMAARPQAEAAAVEAISDFHLFSVPHRTDIRNNQTKQVALFAANDVPVEKFYVFDAMEETETFQPVKIYYEFDNSDANNLGMPIPTGIFRLYANDSRGEAQFVGENKVANTPEDQRVILQPGKAFDVTVQERRTSYSRVEIPDNDPTRTRYQTTIGKEALVKNARDEAVTVRFFEHLPGNWEILDESRDHVQENASDIYWEVPVPAKGEARLTYTKRIW